MQKKLQEELGDQTISLPVSAAASRAWGYKAKCCG